MTQKKTPNQTLSGFGHQSCCVNVNQIVLLGEQHIIPSPYHSPPSDNEIVCFLKVQLAEAINLQDKNQMAQIQETTRCVSRFDARICRKLLAVIAEDYR